MAKKTSKTSTPEVTELPTETDPVTETSNESEQSMSETETMTQDAPATDEIPEQAEMPITAYDEMLDAVRAHNPKFGGQTSREDDQSYMNRFMTALGETSVELFDSLSQGAQTWFNEEVENLNASKAVALPEGFVSKFGVASSGRGQVNNPAGKAGKSPKEPAAPREKGATWPMRLALCADPTIDLAKMKTMFPDAKVATVSTIRSDVLATLSAAREMGWAPKEA